MIGRIQERKELEASLSATEAQLIAVCGRRRVGKTTSGIHVETNELQPRYDSESDNWNIGWFAVVRKRINPFVLVVR